MTHTRKPIEFGNRLYQRQLAYNLVHSLGADGAIDFCSQNGWDGTLCLVLEVKRLTRTPG